MTKLFGIVAHPVEHSLSPAMHNAAFKALSIDATFEKFDVLPEALETFMKERADIEGMAISLPHKEAVGQYLDGVDDVAKQIGAVNTMYKKDGKRWGTNTDAPGFMEALKEGAPNFSGRLAVVLGAGGAARAVITALKPHMDFITIINRTVGKGVQLAKEMGCRYGGKIEDLTTETPDILVNTTSVGLEGNDEPDLVPEDFIEKDMVVFDIVYRQNGTTKLIQHARKKGAITIEGQRMLLHQGAHQFKLWTGKDAPLDVMEKALH